MKRTLLALLLLLCASSLSAQRYRDVVYLKNGSIIKGIVMEQVMNSTLKIKSADGSIFVYSMDDVVRIEKEQESGRRLFVSNKDFQRHYAGSVDLDWHGGIQLSTSQGFQVFPYLFAGVGTGITYWGDTEFSLPVFANARCFLLPDNNITPYLDMRLGASLGKGAYFTFTAGARCQINEKYAVRGGLGFVKEDEEYATLWFAFDF